MNSTQRQKSTVSTCVCPRMGVSLLRPRQTYVAAPSISQSQRLSEICIVCCRCEIGYHDESGTTCHVPSRRPLSRAKEAKLNLVPQYPTLPVVSVLHIRQQAAVVSRQCHHVHVDDIREYLTMIAASGSCQTRCCRCAGKVWQSVVPCI